MATKSKKDPAGQAQELAPQYPRQIQAYRDNPAHRLLISCGAAQEFEIEDGDMHRYRPNAKTEHCQGLPFWMPKQGHEDFADLAKHVEACINSLNPNRNFHQGQPPALGAQGARALLALALHAGIKPEPALEAALQKTKDGAPGAAPAARDDLCKLYAKALAPGIQSMHLQEISEQELSALMAKGRDRLCNHYGLSPEESDGLLADAPACLALHRLAYSGNTDPAALLAIISAPTYADASLSLGAERLFARVKEDKKKRQAGHYYQPRAFDTQTEAGRAGAAKFEELSQAGADLPDGHPLLLFLRLKANTDRHRSQISPGGLLRIALLGLRAENGFSRSARAGLLRATATFEEPQEKDLWAKVDPLGDLQPLELGKQEGSTRLPGSSLRGDAMRLALKDFNAIFMWRNPARLFDSSHPMGAAALAAARQEAEGFARLAPQALALAMDEVAKQGASRRPLTSALAERFAEGFSGIGEFADATDLLPGFERPGAEASAGKWKAGDFGQDPMAGVAMASVKLHGIQAANAPSLVGEAKRAFAERQGLSNAAWKALSANPELRELFAKAAMTSAKEAKASSSKQGIRRQAEDIMEMADKSGASAKAKISALSERERRGHPVEAAAKALSCGANLNLPVEDQAELLELAATPAASSLRALLSGNIPAMPSEIGRASSSSTQAAAAMPLLAEDLQALSSMASAFVKGLCARHRRNLKASGSALEARGLTLREFEDIIDCSRAMPAGFWSRLDPKDPFSHAKRIHQEWVENLAQAKVNGDAGMASAWHPLVDRDNLGRASAKELMTGRALFEEGSAMHHCVSSYSSQCQNGGARIVSLSLDGARSSTLELAPHDSKGNRIHELDFKSLEQRKRVNSWKAVQHRGKCNAVVKHPELLALASQIEARASAAFNAYTEKLSAQRKAEAEAKSASTPPAARPLGM